VVPVRIGVVDNYDSFVYNLVQYVGELGAEPVVVRNDEADMEALEALQPDGLLVSPGPGSPDGSGISLEAIAAFAGRLPVLGVCLGHQCIAAAFGGRVRRAAHLLHGKTSEISHDEQGVFAGLPQPLTATRYHSLEVDPSTLPPDIEVTAWADDGTVMGIRHRKYPVEGVQFHPESVLTGSGRQLVANWLGVCGQVAAVPACRSG
jgi:anthranilate synthase/aminodeoxychorismate synthase-like glutamine amidotransferase